MPDIVLFTGLYTGFFLALHLWALRQWPDRPFHLVLAVSRGWAALCLATLGLATLVGAWHLWRLAFVDARELGDPAYLAVYFILGHLLADFIWLAYGWRARGSRPRLDLVVHHLLGVVACGLVLWLERASLLIGAVLITEFMPVVSGLQAWARLREDAALERRAVRLRLLALLGLRLPCWAFLLWRSITLTFGGQAPAHLALIYPLILAAVLCVLMLDLRWSRMAWRALT